MGAPQRRERLSVMQAFEVYMQSWAKEKGLGIWAFKCQENNSQENIKADVW